MPGILDNIAAALHMNNAQPVEVPAEQAPEIGQQNLAGVAEAFAQRRANDLVNNALDNIAMQAQPGAVIPRDPARQIEFFRYEGEQLGQAAQAAPAPWEAPPSPQQVQPNWNNNINYGQYYQQPWEIRQQIFPQAIETRLSADDVEKIAQRVLILIEEREAE